jgi:hypothetical protein
MGPDELLTGKLGVLDNLPGSVIALPDREGRQLTLAEAFARNVRPRVA